MLEQHFSERLGLRDKFSVLARSVLAIDRKNAYGYFALKHRMRNYGIDVAKDSNKRARQRKPEPLSRQKPRPIKPNDPRRIWFNPYK